MGQLAYLGPTYHLSRSQVMLLSYAPLTRRAVAMVVCRPGVDRDYSFCPAPPGAVKRPWYFPQ